MEEQEESLVTVVWCFCLFLSSSQSKPVVLTGQRTRVRKMQSLPSGDDRLWGRQIHPQVWVTAGNEALSTVTEMNTEAEQRGAEQDSEEPRGLLCGQRGRGHRVGIGKAGRTSGWLGWGEK